MSDMHAESKGPARGYSWPPFAKDHQLSVRHGANSERLVSERAAAILTELKQNYPWLNDADAIVLDVLIKSKARLDLLDAYVDGVIEGTRKAYPRRGYPDTGIEAVPDRIWQQLSRESRIVVEAAGKLGMTPLDRGKLFADTGIARYYGTGGLQVLGAQGRKLRQLRGRA